ncbi:hypothetical protein ACNJYD_08085 [Bradyrhizobium sp. DASA03005]|uniref:hypothetical protein n=1 Tax=Bradyrhizobium sp. SPXBL-02 TaxID=3395912 RepID=UPI003F7271BC
MAFLAIARRQENWRSTGRRRRDLHLGRDINACPCEPLSFTNQQRYKLVQRAIQAIQSIFQRCAQRMSTAMTVCGMLNCLDPASIDILPFTTNRNRASLIGWRVPWIAVRLVCPPQIRCHGFPMLLIRSTSPVDWLSG